MHIVPLLVKVFYVVPQIHRIGIIHPLYYPVFHAQRPLNHMISKIVERNFESSSFLSEESQIRHVRGLLSRRAFARNPSPIKAIDSVPQRRSPFQAICSAI